jgi:SAM-dependent methyltransferase
MMNSQEKTNLSVATFNRRAKEYEDKYMDVSLYADSLNLLCKKMPRQAKILELACGPGNVTHYLLQQRPDLNILGTDLAPKMLELARKNNPSAEFQLMDCRNLLKLSKIYDAIIAGFCLPYLSKEEVEKLFSDAAKILSPNGILYLSTMEGDYTKSGIQLSSYGDQAYIYYHEEDHLQKTLKLNKFNIYSLLRKKTASSDDRITTDLLIIAVK